ncbi:peroxiredoxin-like family protein [Yeosuana sp. MJ-SS3]|uniref:thioredoxin-dependent peroxiredoxin n=1 Tax=Gilvirhabdus luticola TaxID=3079858 RepID=A0ABU3U4X3_9FLAO|nr:peroxiredoxin-like family protein [Yeosuana sp. MJ-SS3]MDU8885165.1 peroxiredoxin-like family protein [Yeosuana sp. MJ-SS3]
MNLKLLALVLLICYSVNGQEFPEKAEDISPLLIGEKFPKASLLDSKGQEVLLNKLIKQKPTVLIFYRGGWCPYCNQQLASLAEAESQIIDLGYQIIAISPDDYSVLKPSIDDNKVTYLLFSDAGAKLIQEVGIGFKTPGMAKMYIKKKTKIDATEVLPVPTVMVVNTSGEILFEYINPNYKQRISEDLLISALKSLKTKL